MALDTLCPRVGRFSRIDGCMFGFLSEEEILKLSTVEVRELKGLSVLGIGEPDGLHDPRMGTLTHRDKSICPVCFNPHRFCPGHIGHIKLVVPLYSPTTFRYLDLILTRKCYNCHRLMFHNRILEVFKHKLKAIEQGFIFNINSLSDLVDLMEESQSGEASKALLTRNSVSKRKKKMKHKKSKRNSKSKSKNKRKRNADDSDSEFEREVNRAIDVREMSEDSGDSVDDMDQDESGDSEHSGDSDDGDDDDHESDAERPVNLDFLNSGHMKGTRQSLLQVRGQLFEFGHILSFYQNTTLSLRTLSTLCTLQKLKFLTLFPFVSDLQSIGFPITI